MTRGLSRLLALGLLALALIALWQFVVAPGLAWRADMLTRTANAQEEHARLLAAKERLELEQGALGASDTELGFWSADQSGEAYARIQGALAKSASESGISFRAMTPLPMTDRDGIEAAVVRIEFEADLAQLTGFLRAIEYASPSLPVDRATLRRLVRPGDTSRMPVMFAQIDIAAPLSVGDGS